MKFKTQAILMILTGLILNVTLYLAPSFLNPDTDGLIYFGIFLMNFLMGVLFLILILTWKDI